MCERYSWIEKDDKIIFLTGDDVFRSKRGKALQRYTPRREDWHGHGAIRWFYDLYGGVDRECTDFSTPKNFPDELAEAIKAGKMWDFGITPGMQSLLLKRPLDEYEIIKQQALAKYEIIRQQAWAKYEIIEQQAWDKYEIIKRLAWAKYMKIQQQTFAKLWKVKSNRKKAWR